MTAVTAARATCDPATALTRSLLGYGVVAGPLYVTVSLAQALTRPGFDLTRHSWSLLSNGRLGWLQITTFIVTGLMTIAYAVGLHRRLAGGTGATWVPRLVGLYGLGLVGAGILRADPADGFPLGTATTTVSGHGIGHLVAGAVGFVGLIGACLILGRRFARAGRSGWAVAARITGVGFLAAFVGIASGPGHPVTTFAFVTAVVGAWTFLTTLAVSLYRTA